EKREALLAQARGLNALAISHDVHAGIFSQRKAQLLRARQERGLGALNDRSLHHQRYTEIGRVLGGEVRMRFQIRPAIDEARAVADIEVTLCRQPFGEEDVVTVELDVPVLHPLARHLRDARSVDELLYMD